MGVHGREIARREYALDTVIERNLQLYAELTGLQGAATVRQTGQ